MTVKELLFLIYCASVVASFVWLMTRKEVQDDLIHRWDKNYGILENILIAWAKSGVPMILMLFLIFIFTPLMVLGILDGIRHPCTCGH